MTKKKFLNFLRELYIHPSIKPMDLTYWINISQYFIKKQNSLTDEEKYYAKILEEVILNYKNDIKFPYIYTLKDLRQNPVAVYKTGKLVFKPYNKYLYEEYEIQNMPCYYNYYAFTYLNESTNVWKYSRIFSPYTFFERKDQIVRKCFPKMNIIVYYSQQKGNQKPDYSFLNIESDGFAVLGYDFENHKFLKEVPLKMETCKYLVKENK